MRSSTLILTVLSAPTLASAFQGTVSFGSILIAHAEPTICPTPLLGGWWVPDDNYIICCEEFANFPRGTLTTAKGPGGKTMYACCGDGYTCTGPAPLMSDWSLDPNSKLRQSRSWNSSCVNYLIQATSRLWHLLRRQHLHKANQPFALLHSRKPR